MNVFDLALSCVVAVGLLAQRHPSLFSSDLAVPLLLFAAAERGGADSNREDNQLDAAAVSALTSLAQCYQEAEAQRPNIESMLMKYAQVCFLLISCVCVFFWLH